VTKLPANTTGKKNMEIKGIMSEKKMHTLDDKIRTQVRRYNGDRHHTQCVGDEFLNWILTKPEKEKYAAYRQGVKRANKRRKREQYIENSRD